MVSILWVEKTFKNCVSPFVSPWTKSQKLINAFVSETTESARIYIYICICIIIYVYLHFMSIQHIYIYICIYIYTSRNLHVRLKEHKRDLRIGNSNNALFLHISPSYHNFDFNSAKMLVYIHNKSLRWIFEAAVISLSNSLNTRPGFYNISSYLSKFILNSYNIFHLLLIFST